jgi:nucleotide-binding universal stress UspA family protein
MDTHIPHLHLVLEPSELGIHTAEFGVGLAARLGAVVTCHVAVPGDAVQANSPASFVSAVAARRQACDEQVAPFFARVQRLAAPAGVVAHAVLTIDEDPCEAVLRLASEEAAAMIVIGSHGGGVLSRVLKGSLADELIRKARRPVLVCREDMLLQGWPLTGPGRPPQALQDG